MIKMMDAVFRCFDILLSLGLGGWRLVNHASIISPTSTRRVSPRPLSAKPNFKEE